MTKLQREMLRHIGLQNRRRNMKRMLKGRIFDMEIVALIGFILVLFGGAALDSESIILPLFVTLIGVIMMFSYAVYSFFKGGSSD